MDSVEVRNRILSSLLAAFGAAATTATFLFMFQDSTLSKSNGITQKRVSKKEQDKMTEGPITNGIPKVGEATDLFPNFLSGLMKFGRNCRSMSNSELGWFDNFGTPTLVVANPEHVRTLFSKTTAHALWGGIKPASEGKLISETKRCVYLTKI